MKNRQAHWVSEKYKKKPENFFPGLFAEVSSKELRS